jgi:hypothetical protein
MKFLDRSGNLANFFMIMCFFVKLVYTKVAKIYCLLLLWLILPQFIPAMVNIVYANDGKIASIYNCYG